MVIKVLFLVLILSTAAIVAVGLAIHFRVKRHLDGAPTEAEPSKMTATPAQDDNTALTPEASEDTNDGKSGDRNT